ncbi:unnamed protein product [Nyctereutes procyonoides]|uniref:(raccoon dog) hypothetical protein n=1 Tax=Nyctereutes procyonoides TaxID=34880 RepID=A0A811YNR7_NYCPR|nr:unnamed protein product [Nyctereutes procyonoides]
MSQKQEEENPAEETSIANEAKLKAKYPSLRQKPGGSDFLMNRLQKGQESVTGDHIPIPQDLSPASCGAVVSPCSPIGLLCIKGRDRMNI